MSEAGIQLEPWQVEACASAAEYGAKGFGVHEKEKEMGEILKYDR